MVRIYQDSEIFNDFVSVDAITTLILTQVALNAGMKEEINTHTT